VGSVHDHGMNLRTGPVRALFVLVVSLAVAGCGDSSASSERNQNRDLVAHRVSAFNGAYDQYTLGVDACSRLQMSRWELAACFDDTYTKSGIRQAIVGFGEAIRQAEGISQGTCRSAMRSLASRIPRLRMAIETFRTDASAGHFERLNDEADAFVKAHDASVKAMERTQQPC
jgi:outer membrane murein-binding lipoprotein Lpp